MSNDPSSVNVLSQIITNNYNSLIFDINRVYNEYQQDLFLYWSQMIEINTSISMNIVSFPAKLHVSMGTVGVKGINSEI